MDVNNKAYQAAGVDVERGYESVRRIRSHIARTHRSGVMGGLGGFGGLFKPNFAQYKNPVLVSGTDGVGTKIILAQQAEKRDTIGIDCVAMCVNDVLALGAEPLFFLDYLAMGYNDPQVSEELVAGIAEGCVQAGAALIGGETAEMPDLYSKEEFDLAGFCVGAVEEDQMIDGSQIKEGDILVGIPSSGIHSNGYSLVRKIFFKDHHYAFDHQLSDGSSLIDCLLEPTRIYVKEVLPLVKKNLVKGMAHITGGGFYENLPRISEADLGFEVDYAKFPTFPIFQEMQDLAKLSTPQMLAVFNMGIGMVLAVAPDKADQVVQQIEDARIIGRVTAPTADKIVWRGIHE